MQLLSQPAGLRTDLEDQASISPDVEYLTHTLPYLADDHGVMDDDYYLAVDPRDLAVSPKEGYRHWGKSRPKEAALIYYRL